MSKWLLTCSVDAVDIDYEEIIEIEGDEEPGFWDCAEIAEAHGCDWWTISGYEEEW